MGGERSFQLDSLACTQSLANSMASVMDVPMTVVLNGQLGTGKTQFARFLAQALEVDVAEVTSPTYVLLQRYVGRFAIYHFDFYRLETAAQVWDLGIDELYEQPVLVLIEWAERFPECLPEQYLEVQFTQLSHQARQAAIKASGAQAEAIMGLLRN